MIYKNIKFNLIDMVNTGCNDSRYSNRKSFLCVGINVCYNESFRKYTQQQVEILKNNLNKGRANDSEQRDEKEVEQDALIGFISEYTCRIMLKERYGCEFTSAQIGKNQIDIVMPNGNTIEVRSSCMRNGSRFSLFYKGNSDGYFDIIGPYVNKYKPYENMKDYYMRVLIPEDKTIFCRKWEDHEELVFYIVGGATKEMMMSEKATKQKYLNPDESNNSEIKTKYRVIPIENSLDAWQILKCIERDNNLVPIKEFNFSRL